MLNNIPNKTKIFLIASIILNLAFISGFMIKKYALPPKRVNSNTILTTTPSPCQMKSQGVGYTHLCKGNPGFKHTFHSFQVYYHQASADLSRIKIQFLHVLKQDKPDNQVLENLIQEIKLKTNELNEKNYRHLISLKALLKPADFVTLMDCMAQALDSHKEMPFPMEKGDCMNNEK